MRFSNSTHSLKTLMLIGSFVTGVNSYNVQAQSVTAPTEGQQLVSTVDTSLDGSEKFVLRIDGKPFYPASIQVRLDKLYGYQGWGDADLEKVLKQAASDGFNTVGIPVFWREVEPTKGKFSWTILDKYMNWCKKYNLRMELLWFSWSSGGRVQYLWNYGGRKEPRTPDYVCSINGTSEYNMLRDEWEYSLDWRDMNLCERERVVLSEVMNHIAQWDEANGNPHTVIGVQLGNEARGHGENTATSTEIINYYHHVGAAVKKSNYVVWTRLNCVNPETKDRTLANEKKRAEGGTNIDFVGIDLYGTNAASVKGDINGMLGHNGSNYRMIMEIDAKDSNSPLYQMAALAGDKAFSYYNFCVVDGNALYNGNGTELVELGHVNDVRNRNKILNAANQDIALKSHGKNLYVYNFTGSNNNSETGLEGISYKPTSTRSQGIAIRHSDTEIVLLSTEGGTFTIPSSLGMTSAEKGRYDENNQWVSEGNYRYIGSRVALTAGLAVRIVTLPTSIEKVNNDKIAGISYFDLTGQEIKNPLPGRLYIERTLYKDGTVNSVKRIF
ncbi:MAG: DUF4978 domain-containing protein [Prevotellaceae bacterium]|nr:DUF4978 domain-containing protein [Prevotellaceae bacterium]